MSTPVITTTTTTTLTTTTTTSPPPSLPANFTFAPSTLYILLADIGHESLFHWGYLLTSAPPPATRTPFLAPVTGTIFHITNMTGPWLYQSPTFPLAHLLKFIPSLLFILKICSIDAILHPALSERLGILGLQAQLKSMESSISPPSDSQPETEDGQREGNEKLSQGEEEKEEMVSSESEITGRTWIKSTLCVLDEEGYISFPETSHRLSSKTVVDSIEAEAVAGAGWNRMRGTVGWDRSVWVGE
ncbi:hypothetical protein BCIN_14g02280 [Botrytis cinerea B05.10]|uniref:Uncharacterized protein n=1 Tax=Botryotinia fuckeliana (strain B05.10) TaxID=332648 RepID=A0A384K2P6_BOTFB|nr:hypothetical protein BCIN_14g02280 [Botrytis cinerea B05.10]ATZ57042.1 hypothetical protein BCIN_14g02280 [Botrytis cinerea B05.10]